jgi:hypothetical protein
MNVMLSHSRHWLEYDSVALAVLLAGIGFVELIVLSIWGCALRGKGLGHAARRQAITQSEFRAAPQTVMSLRRLSRSSHRRS